MQPRIEFPESLLKGRPAPPPITLDELRALPAYIGFDLEAQYSASRRGFEFFGGRYSITVTKTRVIYGSLKINMRFVEPTWESLLLNIFLYFTAQKVNLNFDLAENAYFLKNPNNIKSINFLLKLVKFNLVSEEDFISMRNKVFLSKPISILIGGIHDIGNKNKEILVESIFKRFESLKEDKKYQAALFLAYTDSTTFLRFLKIYGNEKYERILDMIKYRNKFRINNRYIFHCWIAHVGEIFIPIKKESDLASGINIIKLERYLPYFKVFLETLTDLDLVDVI